MAEQREITPGAPGLCEGHNVNGAVMVAAAIALKQEMARSRLQGTIKVFGAPAEEQLVSRPYFVRDGHFDDVDVALHNHISWDLRSVHGQIQSAPISATFTFSGETAHAAMAPWKGRDALDAVVLMDVGLAQYREHMPPGTTAHRVITHGGDQPNVIPAKVAVWWYFRDKSTEGARALFQQAQRIAEGAALMSNCQVAANVLSGVWGTRCNRTVAEVAQANCELVGMPSWSADEQALARRVQEAAGLQIEGLRSACVRFPKSRHPAHPRTIVATFHGGFRWRASISPRTSRTSATITGRPAWPSRLPLLTRAQSPEQRPLRDRCMISSPIHRAGRAGQTNLRGRDRRHTLPSADTAGSGSTD